jgi:hypothetical protein
MEDAEARREAAVKRVKAKRDFKTHAAVYVLVNTLLVVIWMVQGAGEFFPFWSIVGWGIGLGFHAWSVYFRRPISEAEIARELQRG